MTNERVLDKIVKLLRLKDSAETIGSIAEAENASMQIQKLLTEYNLELSDAISTGKAKQSKVEEHSNINYKDGGAGRPGGEWMLKLLIVIGKNNYCDVLFNKHTKKMRLIGRKDNTEVVLYLYDVLCNMLPRMALESYKTTQAKSVNRYVYMRNYIMGACEGIDTKLSLEMEKMRMENNNVTALVLSNKAAVDEYLEEKFPHRKTVKVPSAKVNEAGMRGYNDGKNVNIAKGVEGNNKPTDGKLLN